MEICKKNFHLEIFRLFFQFTFKIQAFSSKLLLSRFRHFLPSYFQDQAFSSKILPRSDIFFQVTSKIRHFLPSYFQDQIFSCKILQDQTFSCKILQDQTLSSKIFQDTCKNNALSSKILEVKSDRFLQEMYGSSTVWVNKTQKPLFLQLGTTKALKKVKIEENFFPIFFSFFEVSGKSHSAEKCKRGTLWDFLNIHSVAKDQKIDGGSNKIFRKK